MVAGAICKEPSKPCCQLINKAKVTCFKIDASVSRCCYPDGWSCTNNQECCGKGCISKYSGARFCQDY